MSDWSCSIKRETTTTQELKKKKVFCLQSNKKLCNLSFIIYPKQHLLHCQSRHGNKLLPSHQPSFKPKTIFKRLSTCQDMSPSYFLGSMSVSSGEKHLIQNCHHVLSLQRYWFCQCVWCKDQLVRSTLSAEVNQLLTLAESDHRGLFSNNSFTRQLLSGLK